MSFSQNNAYFNNVAHTGFSLNTVFFFEDFKVYSGFWTGISVYWSVCDISLGVSGCTPGR